MKCSRDDQTRDGQREKTGGCLSDDRVEVLLETVHTAEEKTHPHDEEKVRQHTPDQRCLHDDDLAIDQGDDRDDKLDGVPIYR